MGRKLKWYKLLPVKQKTASSNLALPAMTTKQLGNIGEAKTLAKLVSMNVPVYVSFGDNEKADLVADFNGKLNKLQVKTSEKFEDNKFTVSLKSSTIRNQVNYVHRYDASEIDYFVVYNLASDTLLMLPIKEFEGRNAVSFRIPYVETHNQYKSLNYEDYLFDKIVNV